MGRICITDRERRARLVARHHLDRSAVDVVTAVRGVAALHSSDPITPHLAMWSRVPDTATADLDHALYEARSVVRMHAMRRTLFVVPTDELGVFTAGAARDVAEKERRQLERWLGDEMDPADVAAWIAEVEEQVLAVLRDGDPRRTKDLAEEVPGLTTEITVGSGKWTTRTPISSRLLFLLALDGRIVRARPAGSWRSSQYHWAATERWLGDRPDEPDPRDAHAELLRGYLATHGPATETDLRWWTGWTAARTRQALEDVAAIVVDLEDDAEGYLLADDPRTPHPLTPPLAFLGGLDPTAMGWKERGWYLGAHAGALFDTNGNAGPTIWVDGRVVGGWAQRPDSEVVWRLLEEVDGGAQATIEREAAELTTWFDGVTVTPRFRTPLERELST